MHWTPNWEPHGAHLLRSSPPPRSCGLQKRQHVILLPRGGGQFGSEPPARSAANSQWWTLGRSGMDSAGLTSLTKHLNDPGKKTNSVF